MTQDNSKMNTNRQSRGGSLFGGDVQMQLRTALSRNDDKTFKNLLEVHRPIVNLEHVYQDPDYKTCLEIAVSEPEKLEFVKILLEYKVEVNKMNKIHKSAPIHFAVENGNVDALNLLLKHETIEINSKCRGNTALLMAIKKIQGRKNERICENMIVELLKAGCDVNSPDLRGITPISFAAQNCLERVVKYILEYSKDLIDLDTYKDVNGKTARYYMEENYLDLLNSMRIKSITKTEDIIDVNILFAYLSSHDEDNFTRDFSKLVERNDHKPILKAINGINTMLQLAVEKGFEKVVLLLLNSGANPNLTFEGNTNPPIAIACRKGYCKILKMFIDNESTLFDSVNSESLIQITVKGMLVGLHDPKANFKGCLDLLLRHPKLNINHQDVKDNTALHYAARNGDNDTVLELLRKGACIGLHNKFNDPPLADINAKTLETYLDECITSNSVRPSDDDYEIRIKYSFLVYPNNSLENELCKVPLIDNTNNNNCSTLKEYDAILAPETEALLYMTRNEELRPLLKHPVITSFLYLKLQRISSLFYANITFYWFLWLCLVLYITLGYEVETQRSKSIEGLNVVTYIGAVIGLILLIIREIFQLLVSPTRYFQSIENWMEIPLIIVTTWILCDYSAQNSTKQQLSAVAILLSSTELVLLIGQFPILSTNIEMLRTVTWNFFKLLLWYSILIIAFALSFYTLFRNNSEDQKPPCNTGEEKEEKEVFFIDPGRSLFKTIIMLTGEFDAGSITFSTFPVTSHIIFIVFVFMIPIVLFNLLNGLAVSDTQKIRADAELVGHISCIKLISYFESIFIGKVYTKPLKCWSWLPPSLQNLDIIKPQMLYIKPFAKRISLFPFFLPKYCITVKPNQDNRIVIPQSEPLGKFGNEDIESGKCCFQQCHAYKLDRKIVKSAKIVINKKKFVSEFDEIKSKLAEYETKIVSLENTLEKFLQNLGGHING